MGEILAFTEGQAPDVAGLFLRTMLGKKSAPPESLQEYFRDVLLRNPWQNPEIPSLVYREQGRAVGFLGVIPRPMLFRDKPIRAAVGTAFVVEREGYRGPAAFELLKKTFAGPQELTYTDGAGESAARIWTTAGAQVARIHSFNWIRILRPAQTAQGFLNRWGGPLGFLKPVARLTAPPIDYLAAKAVSSFRRPVTRVHTQSISSSELARNVREFRGREALKPEYKEAEFDWLMKQAAASVSLGQLRMMAAYDEENQCCGTFVYYVKRGGDGYVLQIGWRRKDTFAEVLRALFLDAWEQGAASVKGQAIPQFLTTLSEEGCTFRQMNSAVLAYSKDQDILNSLLLGDTRVSRLDGECWLHFTSGEWR